MCSVPVELSGIGEYGLSCKIEIPLDEIENLDLCSEAQKKRKFHRSYIPGLRKPQRSRSLAQRDRRSSESPYLWIEAPVNQTCVRDMGRVKQAGKLDSRKKFILLRVSFISHQLEEYSYRHDTGSKEKRNPLKATGSNFKKPNIMMFLGKTGILS